MREARDAFGSLDIVVNCAGFGAIAPLTGDTIAIDGGSLTRGYPALLTGVKRA